MMKNLGLGGGATLQLRPPAPAAFPLQPSPSLSCQPPEAASLPFSPTPPPVSATYHGGVSDRTPSTAPPSSSRPLASSTSSTTTSSASPLLVHFASFLLPLSPCPSHDRVFLSAPFSLGFQVRGPSMLPTINLTGDVVAVERITPRRGTIEVGDVVILISPENPRKTVAKRVLGLQGDAVTFFVDPTHGNATRTVVVCIVFLFLIRFSWHLKRPCII